MNIMIEPWHWFVLGVLLILFELVIPSFAALWFGVAAILVSLLYWLFPAMPFVLQVILWVITSVLCTFAWFKFIKPLSVDKTKAGLSREATIGQVGMVIETQLERGHVRVRFPIPVLGADEWNCRSDAPLQVGDRVRVIDILGNDLLVTPHQHSQQPL